MSKITAVIDIGSNSVRMVVFEKTSRFGFYLLKEIKSKVRISEGAYERGGFLQPEAMDRAELALLEFLNVAKAYKARKILCVATSAVRDAPNKSEFVSRIRQNIGLSIKVIDGEKEAYLGAVAAINLLPVKDGITVDIGGGSTELALIKEGKIAGLISLNLGTVRLKELIFDKHKSYKEALEFVNSELHRIPSDFLSSTIVGIGGTNRALATAFMEMDSYTLDTIHGFSFETAKKMDLLDKIIGSRLNKLKGYGIKPERFDVIREGALIIKCIIEKVDAQTLIASGVGVREGVYLSDILRTQNHIFPANFNPSVRSLTDRFCDNEDDANFVRQKALELFDALKKAHKISDEYKMHVSYGAKLSNIGTKLNFYNRHLHSNYFVLNNLDYGFTHSDKVLIAALTRFHGKKMPTQNNLDHISLMPISLESVRWLSFIVSLANCLNADMSRPKLTFAYEGGKVYIACDRELHLAKEATANLVKPYGIETVFKHTFTTFSSQLP